MHAHHNVVDAKAFVELDNLLGNVVRRSDEKAVFKEFLKGLPEFVLLARRNASLSQPPRVVGLVFGHDRAFSEAVRLLSCRRHKHLSAEWEFIGERTPGLIERAFVCLQLFRD